MLLSNIEYVLLRLLRRFAFSDGFLIKYGKYFPYYNENVNQFNPTPTIETYKKHLQIAGIDFSNIGSILEIGVGATNSTGYEMAAQGFASGGQITMFEPYVGFDQGLDQKIFIDHGYTTEVYGSVRRIKNLSALGSDSVDLVLSNSVLEHVADFPRLITELRRVLKPEGAMLHVVDYRDHFFKYPYHFLQFSKTFWELFLNPGDLPRLRLNDHLDILAGQRLSVEILESEVDKLAFEKIKPHIHAMFTVENNYLSVIRAVLLIKLGIQPFLDK